MKNLQMRPQRREIIICRAFLSPGPDPRTRPPGGPQVGRRADVSLEQGIFSTNFARVLHAGGDGRTPAVQTPLTPRPRGTIWEALPFIFKPDQGGIPRQGQGQEEDMTM